jgi:WhiB family redox-sensing transcriptional regulator
MPIERDPTDHDTMTLGEYLATAVAGPPDPPTPTRLPVELVAVPPRWQSSANCVGVDPAAFFPTRGEPTDEARSVCAGCTVRDECLEFGLHEQYGIWGGLGSRARQRIRVQRARGLAS